MADQESSQARFMGLDFARSIAILGMVLVNYTAVLDEGASPEWLLFLIGTVQGRAAAIFVVLAGVGLSLLSRRALQEQRTDLLWQAKVRLIKRAIFLLILGLMLRLIWSPDILHFYALYLVFSISMLAVSSRVIWSTASLAMVVFIILFYVFDYDAGWEENRAYTDFWTSAGTIRRMFFNGYYPFFPWIAYLLAGMWLGRQNLSDPQRVNKVLFISLTAAVVLQIISWLITGVSNFVEIESETPALGLLSTDPYPPGPFYIATSIGFAFSIIIISQKFATNFPLHPVTRAFVPTGQLALSVYVVHASIGVLILERLGSRFGESASLAATTAMGYCLAAMLLSVLWRSRFERGPLEIILWRVTGDG